MLEGLANSILELQKHRHGRKHLSNLKFELIKLAKNNNYTYQFIKKDFSIAEQVQTRKISLELTFFILNIYFIQLISHNLIKININKFLKSMDI